MIKKVITTDNSKAWVDDFGIVHFNYFPNTEITLEIAKEEIKMLKEIAQEEKICLIIDLANVKSISRDARKFFSSEEQADIISAVAFMIKSPLSKVLANFFLGINKPPMTIKIFTDNNLALKWLNQFYEKIKKKD